MTHGSQSAADAWVPQVGELVDGRYRIEEHLDRGGMGVVLRATDVQTAVEVAVKLLSPEIANHDTSRRRFQREVELMASVDHPNVLHALAFGESHGRLYIVTELLGGDSLKTVIRREGRLDTRRAIGIGREILRGLCAAHDVDVVHRDVKPDNIFVEVGGDGLDRVKVIDFGLAKTISAEENKLTATGMICGTASYVAPELLVSDEVDKAADVYAAALVMLEMLLGRQVFSARSTTQTFMQQLVLPARLPRRLWDEPLGGVLARALNKHPDERYRDAGEMLQALEDGASASNSFVLEKHELPPPPPDELSGFLLDQLADTENRTRATLRRLPRPEPFEPAPQRDAPDGQPGSWLRAWPIAVVAAVALVAAGSLAITQLESPRAALEPATAATAAEKGAVPSRLVVRTAPAEAPGVATPEPATEIAIPPEEPAPPANVGTARAEPAARKAPAPTAEKHDAGVPGEIEKAADKLVEQYVPMP